MMIKYLNLILLLLVANGFVRISCVEPKTEMIFALVKSGARTPEKSELFPHQPFTEEKDWPLGFGHLTNNGKNEMYNLGKVIRENYNSYLGENPNSLAAKSFDIDRCMESAELVAVGAYPPVGEFVWNKECNWQPFAVHLLDRIPEAELYCGNEYDEMKQLLSTNTSEIADKLCQNLVTYLHEKSSNQLNLTCDTLEKITNFYQILKENKLPLPFYVDDIYNKLILFKSFYTEMKTKTRCEQVSSARVLFDIKDKLIDRSKDMDTKIQLYAMTSQKLETILRILEDESDAPKYTVSAVFIDLNSYQTEGNVLQFNLLYEGDQKMVPFRLRGCQNSTTCTLNEFYNLFDSFAIEKVYAMSGKVKAIIVLAALLGAVTTAMSAFMFYVWRKRCNSKKKEYQEISGN